METLELQLSGMSCASCAARVDRALNELDGVEAAVNFALARASITYDPQRHDPEDLVNAVESAGYGARAPDAAAGLADAEELESLKRRLAAAVPLTLPLLGLSMFEGLQFDGWEWLALALATPVVTWIAWPFHRAAWHALQRRTTTMYTLISLGISVAYVWSLVAIAAGEEVYFEIAAAIVTLVTLGGFFEARARHRAGDALRALLELGAREARLLVDGEEIAIPADQVRVGDRFVVRPGEKLPADGVIEAGHAALDTSTLTGEPVPMEVGPGDEVAGATIDTDGRLVIRATRVGADTTLAQIVRLVDEAQRGKAPVQRLADRVAAVFVPVVLAIAAATLIGWLLLDQAADAIPAAVAVLIIACPCALGLATPTALLVGSGRGARLGIVIRGPEILESTRRVTTIVLDKTGTLTEARMQVAEIVGDEDAVRLAGAAEAGSEHPIARAIVDHARAGAEGRALPDPDHFAAHPGLGVEAEVEGARVLVGSPGFVEGRGSPLGTELSAARDRLQAAGRTVVAVAVDGRASVLIAVADAVKPTSRQAVDQLHALGLRTVLLTGDAEPPARAVADELGIERVVAEVMPGEKADVVARLQADGEVVAMVGDGVNDAPALARADLGVAIGTGTDVAIEASDLTLVSGDVRAAADAIRLSRRTLGTIKANLFWAFAYNVAAIPLAAAGLLSPLIAAAAMAFSSVFVVSNSLRLRRFRSTRDALDSSPPRAGRRGFSSPEASVTQRKNEEEPWLAETSESP